MKRKRRLKKKVKRALIFILCIICIAITVPLTVTVLKNPHDIPSSVEFNEELPDVMDGQKDSVTESLELDLVKTLEEIKKYHRCKLIYL